MPALSLRPLFLAGSGSYGLWSVLQSLLSYVRTGLLILVVDMDEMLMEQMDEAPLNSGR